MRGKPIRKLRMCGCDISPETDKQGLQHVVSDVDWDDCDSEYEELALEDEYTLKQHWLFG